MGAISMRKRGSLSREHHYHDGESTVNNANTYVGQAYREPDNLQYTPNKYAISKNIDNLDVMPAGLSQANTNTRGYQSSAAYVLPVSSPFAENFDEVADFDLDNSQQQLNARV